MIEFHAADNARQRSAPREGIIDIVVELGRPDNRKDLRCQYVKNGIAGVVTCRRVGRENRFRIRPAPITRARDYLTRASAQWDEAIARLKSAVEE